LSLWFLLILACAPSPTPQLTVFAAASLTDVLPRIGQDYTARTGQEVDFAFDSSSRMARQLGAGAQADVFVSADAEWMDWATERGAIDASTRINLLSNGLAVVVPVGAERMPRNVDDLRAYPKIAVAGENVPAGRYARAALKNSGVWDDIADQIVAGDDVRTVSAWVGAGVVDIGVVYRTDALANKRLLPVFSLPSESHPPIIYPGAVIARSRHPDHARAFLYFLATGGRVHFAQAGFEVLDP
jgi:molybdate transport system substrate-binding protein